MNMNREKRQVGLTSSELQALSVPWKLRFLLGVEYEIVLCITEVGRRSRFSLRFPQCPLEFQQLMKLCAARFNLKCVHLDGSTTLYGVAEMPLLRYADYLPGALHVEELHECLQVKPSLRPVRDATSGEPNVFVTSLGSYDEYATHPKLSEDDDDLGMHLTLDYGLPLATHGHLVAITFHGPGGVNEDIKEFQQFCEWETFDLRFDNECTRGSGGVIVMPSVQDANDVFEKYEDEEEDDLLNFTLRPVAPLTRVPGVEDSALRKRRPQNWEKVLKHWETFSKTKNCVVVYNLYEGATLDEVLAIFDGLLIEAASLVEDLSPKHRRRVFLTLATSDASLEALSFDGKSMRGKTLRVQVAPPYIDHTRRGHTIDSRDSKTGLLSCSGNGVKTAEDGGATKAKLAAGAKHKGGGERSSSAVKPVRNAAAEGSDVGPKGEPMKSTPSHGPAAGRESRSGRAAAGGSSNGEMGQKPHQGSDAVAAVSGTPASLSPKPSPARGGDRGNRDAVDSTIAAGGSHAPQAGEKAAHAPSSVAAKCASAPTTAAAIERDVVMSHARCTGAIAVRPSLSPYIPKPASCSGRGVKSTAAIPAGAAKTVEQVGDATAGPHRSPRSGAPAPREYHPPVPPSHDDHKDPFSLPTSPSTKPMNVRAKEFIPSNNLLSNLTQSSNPRWSYDGPGMVQPPAYGSISPPMYGTAPSSLSLGASAGGAPPPPYSLPPSYEAHQSAVLASHGPPAYVGDGRGHGNRRRH